MEVLAMESNKVDTEWKWLQSISEELFKEKYMLQNEKTINEVFLGVANEISSVENPVIQEEIRDKFYNAMKDGEFIPGGRILSNARPNSPIKNYNNCFTIAIEDSMEGIFDSLKEDALISKVGGGVGFDISNIRPKGSSLTKGGEASGPISFLKIFNQSAKTIKTGGFRRAAHIALMDVSHPDIEEFITIKQGDRNKELSNFNLSVKMTDEFVNAYKNDDLWELKFDGKVYKTMHAKELYDLIVKNAYVHNEPGIFNQDIAERYNNGWWAIKLSCVNPCGELIMAPYNLCCLSSINFSKLIVDPFTENAQFDFERYKELIKIGIRFLDNVLDVAEYPLEKIEKNSRQWRRIGLGFTGLGDAFVMMKMKYGSEESKKLSHEIGKIMRDTAYQSSCDLAKEKGAFIACDNEKLLQANFIKNLPRDIQVQIAEHGLRNIQMLTVPPTGTISLTVGNNCSSGIEPIIQREYHRNVRTGNEDETKKEAVYDYAWLKYKEMIKEESPEVPDYFVTTVDIDPYDAIDIQAIFQKYIDHSISKTLNLPPNTTFDQYKDLFMTAYDKGLKGFTSFNPQGSLKGILEYSNCTKMTEARPIYIERNSSPKRPQDLKCDIHEISVSGIRHIILVGKLNGTLYEMFVTHNPENKIDLKQNKVGIIRKAKRGRYNLIVQNGEQKTMIEDIGSIFDKDYGTFSRLISTALRHGVPLSFLVDQLSKDKNFVSFGRSVSRILKKYIKDGEWVITSDKCDECKGELVYQEGCKKCISCGWTKCD